MNLSPLGVALGALLVTVPAVVQAALPSQSGHSVSWRKPLVFEPAGADFLSRGPGYALKVGTSGTHLAVRGAKGREVVSVQWPGANPKAQWRGVGRPVSSSNYLVGRDAAKWRQGVPNFTRVAAKSVYPGVDLVFYGNQKSLEYDWQVAPGADPSRIRLKIGGTRKIALSPAGDLNITMSSGTLTQHKPVAFQLVNGRRQPVAAAYELRGREVRLKLARYDRRKPLTIDPVFSYSTYLGGALTEDSGDLGLDADGNLYVVGGTESVDFPVKNAFDVDYNGGPQPYPATQDAFITKYNSSGAVVWSTYFGGATQQDRGYRIKVDASGNPVIAGITASSDFPVRNAYQSALGGGVDAFLLKLTADGKTIIYSTYYGGSGSEGSDLVDDSDPGSVGNFIQGVRLDIDGSGNVYLGGNTHSRDLPVRNAFQSANAGGDDAFFAKFSTAANRLALVYATYFGGNRFDAVSSIAVDAVGQAFLCGFTDSDNLPQKNAVQLAFGGREDGWVAKFAANGQSLVFSTFLGGAATDRLFGVVIDRAGNAVVCGRSDSDDFPLVNALQPALAGGVDAVLAKIPPQGGSLLFSTYYGGSGGDRARALTVDTADNICAVGDAQGSFPVRLPLQARSGGSADMFMMKVSSDGGSVLNSSFLGGRGRERGTSVALDRQDNWFVLGQSDSVNYPLKNAAQPALGGVRDTCISKISFKAYASTPGAASAGKIAFVSTRDGNSEIYVMNDNGTNQTRLTNNTATDDGPSFSRLGSRIVFSSLRDGNREIYVMNANGSSQTRLTNNVALDYDPVFSPNGARIAFVSTRDGNAEIYVMNADGSGQTRLFANAATDDSPAWSPDGTTIAFRSNRASKNSDIYLADANPAGLVGAARLTTDARNDARPAWSPDGNALIFQSDRGGNYQIYVMASDGLRPTRLTSQGQIDTLPCFSPNGASIAFATTRGDGDNEIAVMRRDGEQFGVTLLTNNSAGDTDPTWAPGSVVAPLKAAPLAAGKTAPVISSVTASTSGTVVVTFTTPLPIAPQLTVTVNGIEVAPTAAELQGGSSVILQLPALRVGDTVKVVGDGGSATTAAR